ncbi:hypothetical protein C0Q70_21500 [Pomacea canaliculata]|uniref:Uncharacterized protein n=1 Tax=Pomacea canaliculata TaxID=400727 RepID=A0A2T7NCP8_POMCA|nr:hypothetical protein C0Q70_21500 [Pomacea canaliculata]
MDASSRHSALDDDDATNNQKPLKLTRQDAKSNIADVVVDVEDPSPSVTETAAEVEGECPDVDNDDGVSTSRNGRSGTSAKLISMSIWDTHDGDRNLRATSRRVFWDLDSKGVLAGISEQEEHSSQDDIRSVASSSHTSRSLQATPEKQRDPSRERDPVGTTRSRRRRTTRRSLSLPTGSLSYGDVKITYRDGHFVTEPIAVASAGGDRGEGCDEKVTNAKYERSGSDTTAVLRGSFMNIGSQEEMREEIFSLLERGFSTEDITLYFSHYLDWNSNHLGSSNSDSVSGSQSGSTQSLTTAGLVSSLPRRYRTRDGANRPMSVDGFKLWEQISQSEQNLAMEGVDVVPDGVRKRNNSFCEAMETISMVDSSSLSQDVCDGGEVRLHRQNSEELRTDKNKSQRPGFIQRMLQKRKSFSEKTSSSKSQSQQKDEGSAVSARKEAREPITRKVSIKGIFRRKNSTTSLDSKKDPDEPGSPPIATFMNDDDIGAMNSLPGSPVASTLSRRVSSDSQFQVLVKENSRVQQIYAVQWIPQWQ